MAALVESMYSVREVPWHGLGTIVQEALTSVDAIKIAGLDWEIIKQPIFTDNGEPIPNYFATTRNTDKAVMGVVGNRYQVVQNKEAFDFTDSLIGGEVKYETAGSLKGGKTVWLLAKLPEQKVLGDKFDPYVCFTNNHDGFGSIRACMTPIRVVCNNTLNLALSTTQRCWSTKHVGDIGTKLKEAQITLQLANQYMNELGTTADQLAVEKMSQNDVKNALNIMFPVTEDASDRAKQNVQDKRQEIIVCMLAPDLANFEGTKWQFLNAVSDYVTHSDGKRKTPTFGESRWGSIIGGHPIMDLAYDIVTA